jgi:DinB superfamily
MAIVPDSKNWTWVLERDCPECGFHAADVDPLAMADAVMNSAAQWTALLSEPAARQRPDDRTWSATEYGCHVRDVFDLYAGRLRQMLSQDGPQYANWDQDVTAVEQRYDQQDPGNVAAQLLESARDVASVFASVTSADLGRTGYRSDGVAFTIDGFARYFIHDPLHHLHDVRAGYQRIANGAKRGITPE